MTLPTLEIQLTREFYLRQRDALLAMVDAYERLLGISPRTSELRQEVKRERYAVEIKETEIVSERK